jgi:hypothetical protein
VGILQSYQKFIVLLLALAFVLTGCSMPTLDDLYCLPKRFNSDSNLQEVIDDAMDGLQFSAPISGANQQTVQAADLDGDGKDEYLLFAKDSTERPLKILIFTELAVGYVLMDTIEGNGFAFEFVEYANVDDRPGLEIIVGRQVSEQVVRSVAVYRFSSGFSRQLMSASYSRIVTEDFDGNGFEDLFLVYPGQAEDSPAVAALYSYREDQLRRSMEVNLSSPADALKRVVASKLIDGTVAVFATTVPDENHLVTDVFAVSQHQINQVLMNFKTETLHNYYVYPEDMDGDGNLELPRLVPMNAVEDAQRQYSIDWFGTDKAGNLSKKVSTYHNFDEGWYLKLDPAWSEELSVVQTEDSYAFKTWSGADQKKELFTILILSGPDREEQAKQEGFRLLYRGETEIYVLTVPEGSELDAQMIAGNFRLIRSDWNNEEDREEEDEKSSDSGR